MARVNGIYHYLFEQVTAKPPDIVLVHGAGSSHLVWPPELRRMVDRRVYAVDLPGHGKSGGTGEQTVLAYRTHLVNWMEALGLSRTLLIGHGLGAQIALDLALHAGRLVAGLGLMGAAARMPLSNELLDSLATAASLQGTIQTYAEKLSGTPGDDRRSSPELERLMRTRPGVLYGDFLASQSFDPGIENGQLLKPVLIFAGDKDRITPVRYAQFLAKQLDDAQLEIVHDAGHLVMQDQPGAIASRLNQFIEERLHLS